MALTDRGNLGWILRGLALVAVLTMALYAFRSGVDVSDRPGLPRQGLLTHLYYATGLFFLGGLDLGTPVSGPAAARAMLWTAYFLGPLITTSAVIEGALRLVGSGLLDRFGLTNHFVVVGLGRLGASFVTALRERDEDSIIVGVDEDVQAASVVQVRRRHRIRAVPGDARVPGFLDMLALERAKGVALLTGDDLVNLEASWRLAKRYPHLKVVAHVSDLGMERAFGAVRSGDGAGRVRIFNAHRVAAEHLYENHLQAHFEETSPKDTVVLAGFGRFGQTILEHLEAQARGELRKVVVADLRAKPRVRAYREEVPIDAPSELAAVEGDLDDPETWLGIGEALGVLEAPPVIVLGCDDDRVNLRGALRARSRWPDSHIFVRCQNESAFTEELAEHAHFAVLEVEGMLYAALQDAQAKWLGEG